MFIVFLLHSSPIAMVIAYVFHLITYIGLFRKMKINLPYAFIPFVAEWKMSTVVFKTMRPYFHAMFSICIFLAASFYLGSGSLMGAVFEVFGMLIYWFFLFLLKFNISKSFGKGIPFSILVAIVGTLMLWYLGYSKAEFVGGPSKVDTRPKWLRIILNVSVVLLTIVEYVVLIGVVGILSIREYPPRFLAEMVVEESIASAAGITQTSEVVKRETTMGEAAAGLEQYRARDYFYPDHSADESVVVMDYICATDLESKAGFASVNIAQAMDATKEGDGLTFVMQVGGAKRLFTSGMKDGTYARYTLNGGKLEKVLDLPSTTCMTEPQSLTDFITWTKENYPADRYMLVLWDHGGGLSGGYGYDQLNLRADNQRLMPSSDVVEAVKNSGVTFDLIGFDTCLMQDLDVAVGLEPYTDYFLASEEVESGYGWNYTLGFSELAKNPGISTEQFGEYMIGSFDPYNRTLGGNDTPDTLSTLSLIDMTYVKTMNDKLGHFFDKENEAILASSDNYANVSIAASKAYKFTGNEQMDLIDYLTNLRELDYNEAILKDQEMDDLICSVQAGIVMRNADSAKGINGIAFSFPVESLGTYGLVDQQLVTLGVPNQKSMYGDYFSIMAAQQMKAVKNDGFLSMLTPDYTQEPWYVKGFENYDTADTFVDIPLKDTGAGYEIELPDKLWNMITDVQVAVYMRTQDGNIYLGSDHIGSEDENGWPLIAMDNTWPHIGDSLICYEASMPRETEEGTVFSGKTTAMLNGRTKIVLYLETDPVSEDMQGAIESHVTGYEIADDPLAFAKKGLESLDAGDTLEFLFDYYDEEGKLIKTDTYGKKVRVTNGKNVVVKDEPLGTCDIRFGGKLTDIYERTFLTETIEAHVE